MQKIRKFHRGVFLQHPDLKYNIKHSENLKSLGAIQDHSIEFNDFKDCNLLYNILVIQKNLNLGDCGMAHPLSH